MLEEYKVIYHNITDFNDPLNNKKCIIETICPKCNQIYIRETYIAIPPAILSLSMCEKCEKEDIIICGNPYEK